VSNGTASGGKTAADKNQPWQCRAFTPRVKKQPDKSVPGFYLPPHSQFLGTPVVRVKHRH
jgi:hypothetical protein